MSDKALNTTEFGTGAVRSADIAGLDFTSLPLLAFFGLARTASEGAQKYGRYNYMQGMPVHDLLNHAITHILMDLLGDRSEPNLEHAAWGILVAIQSRLLNPELSAPHMLGPGATLTDANKAHLAAMAPILKKKREAGEFADSGHWKMEDIPQVRKLLEQRNHVEPTPDDVRHRERCRKFDEAIKEQDRQFRLDQINDEYPNKPAPEAKPNRLFAVTHDGATRAVYGEIWHRDKVDPDQESPWQKVYLVHRPECYYGLMSAELNSVRTMVVTRTDWEKAPRSIILHPGFDVSTGTINGVLVIGYSRAATMTSPAEEIKQEFEFSKEELQERRHRAHTGPAIMLDEDGMPF